MKSVAIIPIHSFSNRLKDKVSLKINDKTLAQLTYEQVIKAQNIDEVFFATNEQKLLNLCKEFTDNILMTKLEHNTGTDRVAEANEIIQGEIVINVQVDEVFVSPKLIDKLVELTQKYPVTSAMSKIKDFEDLKSPNTVKVVTDKNQNAIYFSRAIIPFLGNGEKQIEDKNYYSHIGIYGFRKEILKKFNSLQRSELEKIENLEQLRLIENGIGIKMLKTTDAHFAINSLKDYEKAISN